MPVSVCSMSTLNFNVRSFYLNLGHGYHTEGLTCLAITWDSQSIVSGSQDNSVHIVNINSGQVGVYHDSAFFILNIKVDESFPSIHEN